MNMLSRAIKACNDSPIPLAEACRVTYQAVRKWEKNGRFPPSEHVGKTEYAKAIAGISVVAEAGITADALLEWSQKRWASGRRRLRARAAAPTAVRVDG